MYRCLADFFLVHSMSNNNYKCDLPQKNKFSISKTIISIIPWMIVSGLLWAGVFVKPTVTIEKVETPAIEPRDNIYGVDVVDSENIWLVGSYGKILRSNDSGSTWRLQKTKETNHFQDVSAWNNNKAVSVGNTGVVLITEDSGETWKEIIVPKNEVANKLLRVHTYINGEAWSVGEFGAILKTNDYGRSWGKMREDEDVILNDIIKINDSKVIAVGEFGTILISDNDGDSWSLVELDFDIESSLMAIEFKDQFNGLAVGLDGLIIKTEDGGITWQRVETSGGKVSEHLMDIIWDEDRNVWFSVGNKGVWVEIDNSLENLKSGIFDKMDLSWHTEINLVDGEYVAVGANVGKFSPKYNKFVELSDKLVW